MEIILFSGSLIGITTLGVVCVNFIIKKIHYLNLTQTG